MKIKGCGSGRGSKRCSEGGGGRGGGGGEGGGEALTGALAGDRLTQMSSASQSLSDNHLRAKSLILFIQKLQSFFLCAGPRVPSALQNKGFHIPYRVSERVSYIFCMHTHTDTHTHTHTWQRVTFQATQSTVYRLMGSAMKRRNGEQSLHESSKLHGQVASRRGQLARRIHRTC